MIIMGCLMFEESIVYVEKSVDELFSWKMNMNREFYVKWVEIIISYDFYLINGANQIVCSKVMMFDVHAPCVMRAGTNIVSLYNIFENSVFSI